LKQRLVVNEIESYRRFVLTAARDGGSAMT